MQIALEGFTPWPLTPLSKLVSNACKYSILMGTFFLSERCKLVHFLFSCLCCSSPPVLILWFPHAFLNQEITSLSWHSQEVLETSGDRLSGVCTFLGCRESRHCMGRARAAPKSGWLFVFLFRATYFPQMTSCQ